MSRVKIAVLKIGYCPELELRDVPEPPDLRTSQIKCPKNRG